MEDKSLKHGSVDIRKVSIDEAELQQIIKALYSDEFSYEESLIGMGLVKEWKYPSGESKYSITLKG